MPAGGTTANRRSNVYMRGKTKMNNKEAMHRISKLQGTLMKLIAQLESCKLILVGADAPDLEKQKGELI